MIVSKSNPSMLSVVVMLWAMTVCGGGEPWRDVPEANKPAVIMGRDYWTIFLSWQYSDPSVPFRKDDDPELAKLPMFRDCALLYQSSVHLPKKGDRFHYKTIEEEFAAPNSVRWRALEANVHPDRPFVIEVNSKRGIRAMRYGDRYEVDVPGYMEWKARHPNFFGFRMLSEWGNDMNLHYIHRGSLDLGSPWVASYGRLYSDYDYLDRYGRHGVANEYIDMALQNHYNDITAFTALRSLSGLDHLAAARGAKGITLETTNTTDDQREYRWDVSSMFTRGAARQFGIPWAWFVASMLNGPDRDGKFHPNSGPTHVPEGGISSSLENRVLYYAYLNGANAVEPESWYGSFFEPDPATGKKRLSIRGRNFNAFHVFTREHPDRGITYAPVAVLTPYEQGYPCVGGAQWALDYNIGDHMLDGVFFTIAPGWDRKKVFRQGYTEMCLHNSEIPMMFDVLVPDTPQPRKRFSEVLGRYPAAILAGKYRDGDVFAPVLADYVRNGGYLVTPKASLPKGMLPAGATGKMLKNGNGKVMGRLYRIGKGRLAVSETEWMAPEYDASKTYGLMLRTMAGKVSFPETEYFIGALRDEFFPVKVSGDIQYGLNRTKSGWWLWFFNNRGVRKFADAFQEVDETKAARIRADVSRLGVTSARELIRGEDVRLAGGSVEYTVPAGSLAVFQLK